MTRLTERVNMHICCICGKEYEGYGNNAWPISDGKCCDKCNYNVVIPKRVEDLFFKDRGKNND